MWTCKSHFFFYSVLLVCEVGTFLIQKAPTAAQPQGAVRAYVPADLSLEERQQMDVKSL